MNKMKDMQDSFVVKVDLAKAYDNLSWNFINNVLFEIGLHDNLIQVIMAAMSYVSMNIRWKDAESNYFQAKKGLRKGGSISPYLFVLSMDKLSYMINEVVEKEDWIGIRAGRIWPIISHLMFADDLILFGKATKKQMHCVENVLNSFCKQCGKIVSIEKTRVLFSKNTPLVVKREILNLSRIKETSNLGKYVRMPLTSKTPMHKYINYILENAKSKLTSWKVKHLSFADRVTLAKSVLEVILTYTMMSNVIPKESLKEIQALQRNFIWDDTETA